MLIAAPAFSSLRRDIPDLPFLADITDPSPFNVSLIAGFMTNNTGLSAGPTGLIPDQPRLSGKIRPSAVFAIAC
jgi:hypothetical protein